MNRAYGVAVDWGRAYSCADTITITPRRRLRDGSHATKSSLSQCGQVFARCRGRRDSDRRCFLIGTAFRSDRIFLNCVNRAGHVVSKEETRVC